MGLEAIVKKVIGYICLTLRHCLCRCTSSLLLTFSYIKEAARTASHAVAGKHSQTLENEEPDFSFRRFLKSNVHKKE